MKKKTLKATSLKNTMVFMIVLIVVASGVGFYYAQDWLDKMATDINQSSTAATSTEDSDAKALKQIREDIAKNQAIADKASSITLPSGNYKDQISKDINKYAKDNRISIESISVASSPNTSSSTIINGVTSSFVSVTIEGSVTMNDLLQFIKDIETSIPKMQITGINLEKSQHSSDVVVEPIIIEVYTK